MPPKKYTLLSVNVSRKELDRVNQLAKTRGYRFTSDYLRALIEADAEAHGEKIEFEVNRGGDRRGPQDEEE